MNTALNLSYALAKQLPSAYEIASNYGALALDDELRQAVEAAIRPILERRLKEAEADQESGLALKLDAFERRQLSRVAEIEGVAMAEAASRCLREALRRRIDEDLAAKAKEIQGS